jgi:hypothetical protein
MPPCVLLGVPSYRHVPPFGLQSMLNLVYENTGKGLLGPPIFLTNLFVDEARNRIVSAALDARAQGFTHLWFVDDDMLVPTGTLTKLLAHNVPVVSGAIYTHAGAAAAYRWDPTRPDPHVPITEFPRTGLITADAIGLACALIRLDVLAAMRDHFHDELWFLRVTERHLDRHLVYGEDFYFSRRLRELGIPMQVDCSAETGHVSQQVVGRTLFENLRAAAAAAAANA